MKSALDFWGGGVVWGGSAGCLLGGAGHGGQGPEIETEPVGGHEAGDAVQVQLVHVQHCGSVGVFVILPMHRLL